MVNELTSAKSQENNPASELSAETGLFRAIRARRMIKQGLNPEIYQLRRMADGAWETGLSVGLANFYNNSASEYAQGCGLTCYGVMALTVGRVRSITTRTVPQLTLEVESDHPHHWQIVGMPPPDPDNLELLEESERIGGLLVKLSHLAWPSENALG